MKVFGPLVRLTGALALTALMVSTGEAQTPQGFAVTGTIVGSNDNAPRAGVSVQLKGTNTGVISVSGGGYQITARNAADTLVFTFLGFTTQEVPVNGRAVINVTLQQSVLALQEIIVQGYGAQARELVSGAVSQVSSEQLEGSAFNTISDALMGLVQGANIRMMSGQGAASGDFSGQARTSNTGAGATVAGDAADGRPGAPAAFQIRNMGTPLFLIDNVPVTQEAFNNLNPNDIETVSLLRDAAAAVYGFRAANGVVLVTTKRGGRDNAPRVQVSTYYGAQNPTRFHFEHMVNAYEYQHSLVDSRANIQAITYQSNGTVGYGIPTEVSPEELENWRIGAPGYESYDYYKIIMNNPNAAQYGADLSVSGGSSNVQYRLSLGHQQQDYIIKDPTYGRSNMSANLSANLTDRLQIGTELRASNAVRQDIAIPGAVDPLRTAIISINTNLPIHRPYIGPNNDLINYDIRGAARPRIAGQLFFDVAGKAIDTRREFAGNLWAEYSFPFGTKLRGTFNASTSNRAYDLRRQSYDAYCTDPATGEVYNCFTYTNRDRQRLRNSSDRTFMSLQASQSFRFGAHSINAVGFWEREGSENTQDIILASAATNYSDLVDFTLISNYENTWGINRRASMGGRIDYDYNQKYLATLLGRYDGTHLYAPGKRWGFFPGVSLGWRITEEGFMQDRFDFLNEMKLRGSWGQTGSENAAAWAYLEGATYGVGAGSVLNNVLVKGVRPRGLPQTNLTWVTNTSKNIGLDMTFLNGKLTTEVDYFERLQTGIPASRSDVVLPSELGYGLPNENLNADITKGMEAMVTWNSRVGGVGYQLSPNMTISRSAPHFRYRQMFGSAYQEYRSGALAGRWSGTNFGYKVIGQFRSFDEIANFPVNQQGTNQGNRLLLPGDFMYEDVNGDGIIDDFDARPMGYSTSGTPILSFGMGSRVTYGNLALTANFAGASMFSHLRQFETRVLSQNDHTMAKYAQDRWMRADPYNPQSEWIPGRYPALRKNTGSRAYDLDSDFWRTNVRFLRIRRVELSYSVPDALAGNVGLSGLRVYTNIQNPVSFDNQAHINIDPEVTQGNAMVYPTTRLVMVGFSASVGGR